MHQNEYAVCVCQAQRQLANCSNACDQNVLLKLHTHSANATLNHLVLLWPPLKTQNSTSNHSFRQPANCSEAGNKCSATEGQELTGQ